MIRNIFLLAFWLSALSLHAQQTLVCNGETRVPMRDVDVSVDSSFVGRTTWQGLITLPTDYHKATFRRKGFLTETLLRSEVVRDTVFLFPNVNSLDEVVVWGEKMLNAKELRSNIPYLDPSKKRPTPILSFDLGDVLDKRKRHDIKTLKKTREVFRHMDEQEDPIARAYYNTMAEMERQRRQQEAAVDSTKVATKPTK